MTYQRCFRDKRGIILLDIMVALALAGLWISLMMEVSGGARSIFYRAKMRNELMDAYESQNAGSIDGVSIEARAVPYGNEMTETITDIQRESERITFIDVHKNPELTVNDQSSCSVDFKQKNPTGSYGYLIGTVSRSLRVQELSLPIDPTLPLTDFGVRDGIAFISADSSRSLDPDILMINLSSSSPEYVTGINTGPGISAISVFGDTIYAAAASSATQLHMVTRNSPNSLVLLGKYKLPLPYATATPPFATAIRYDSNKIFLGTEKWDGAELFIIDPADHNSLNVEGRFEVGGKVNSILLHDKTVYVAGANDSQLLTVDMSDPYYPTLIEKLTPSGWLRQDGRVISLFEGKKAFGRTSGGFNISSDHELFLWGSSTTSILDESQSFDLAGGVYGMVQHRSGTFIATRNLGSELLLLEQNGTFEKLHLPQLPLKMTCDGDSLYVLSKDAPVIYRLFYEEQ